MDYSVTYDPAAAAAAASVGTAAVGLAAVWVIFWVIFAFGGLALFLWALIDVIRRQFPNQNDKILWIVLIILISWIGPILYLIIGRKKGTIPDK
ncbi:MAG: hypothetical protein US94_C0036G0006 [Berkelbacteria bacterium GW2011_GWB1_38_5]|uniref:Cardiolipin synthase N-terminal domain-containing protein n=2 Tax=Candidatus Berkelbacteria TaxID=1618330 RepID=A0A0G0LIW3_9BACT|nr:MAG: hypothetical protein US94_C0036G0006 [Berkelbacteria bacterium GW2011_GWB1_38_5]KKQ90982.1 MAG: hypothetical protein UT15_C0002G0055 [Berkelbacteria bacterium GW2011_GWA1_39_10]